MTNLQRLVIGVIAVGAILGSVAFFGLSPYGKQVVQEVAGSPVGTNFQDAKLPAVTFSLLNSTSTSILNPFGQTVYVLGPDVACNGVGSSQTVYTGAGLASLTMLIGTSSIAASSANGNFSPWAEVGNLTIATSSSQFLLASSTTQTATSTNAIQWPVNTYMYFQTNATNTATCTVGVATLGQ